MYCSLESAPVFERCVFSGNSSLRGGGVACHTATPRFIDCLFIDNYASNSGGALSSFYSSPVFSGCTFVGNSAGSFGSGMWFQGSPAPAVERTIIAYGRQAAAVHCDTLTTLSISCCDIYGNTGGDWVGCIADQEGVNGNFSASPIFCGADSGDFTLSANSPCLPGNHPNGDDCGLIGAYGEGCDAIAVPVDDIARARLRVRPNPFRSAVRLTAEPPPAGEMFVDVFDVAGRRIRSFRPHSATETIEWGGLRDDGRTALPGMYFIRVSTREWVDTRRVLLIR